jgi:hypothetical protein
MMQYDVKAAYTASDAALVAQPVRVKGLCVAVATAGADPVILYDNTSAASGTVLLKISAAVAGVTTILIPGEGIRALNGVYCDTGSAAAVTVFYG